MKVKHRAKRETTVCFFQTSREQSAALSRKAKAQGLSKAEYLRRVCAEALDGKRTIWQRLGVG